MDEKEVGIEEVLASGPPNEWYFGIGYPDTGILKVGMSSRFKESFGDDIAGKYQNWRHIHSPDGIPEHLQRLARRIVGEVRNATGFSPQQIADKANQLNSLFRGKSEAPFEVELVDKE